VGPSHATTTHTRRSREMGTVMGNFDDMGAADDAVVLAGGGYSDMGYTRSRRSWGSAAPRRQALAAYQPDASGVAVDQVMPFTTGTFTSVVTALNLTAQPQRAFQLRRLVIDRLNTGATAIGMVLVTGLVVGADAQLVNTGSIPAAMFSPLAVGTGLKPAAARPGITITLSLALQGALTNPDTVFIAAAASGPAIG
jgi:hypothetical protein